MGNLPGENIKIYLSHRRIDGQIPVLVSEMQTQLCEAGYEVMPTPGVILSSTEWVKSVRERVINSDIFCIVISEATSASEWVHREFAWALNAKMTILPILLNNANFEFSGMMGQFLQSVQMLPYDGAASNNLFLQTIQQMAEVAQKKKRRKIIRSRTDSLPNYALLSQDDGKLKPVMNRFWENPTSDLNHQCDIFVIMPFEEPFNTIYENHIKPIAAKYKLVMKRGDDFFSGAPIVKDVWSAMFYAYIFIAECTGQNPNVFYELGMAHTLNKSGLMIVQDIEDIPFDIRHLRHILYEDTTEGRVQLQQRLETAIVKMLYGEDLEQ
jgi:hypothetical protein